VNEDDPDYQRRKDSSGSVDFIDVTDRAQIAG